MSISSEYIYIYIYIYIKVFPAHTHTHIHIDKGTMVYKVDNSNNSCRVINKCIKKVWIDMWLWVCADI